MKVIEKKYLLPFILVTSLFLLWGLANNMTDTLLSAFKNIMSMSDTQTSLIQFAFYGAYFVIALPAALYIKKHSYKRGVILGLCLYAGGAIFFLPAAMASSYFLYLIAIYIMASGCSVLETTANPYIMSMGSSDTATRRLNIAQSFNPIGSILGILFSKFFILRDISLSSISGTYCVLGVVLVFIMTVMLFVRMPEGKNNIETDSIMASFRRLINNKLYRFGVIAQFFYVGAQIGVWSFTIRIVMQELGVVEAAAASIYLYSIIGFCLSRFIYTWLMKFYAPSKLLLFGSIMSLLCCLSVVFGEGLGWFMVVPLMLVSFFMSLMFPTIYGISMSGVGSDAKIGASGLIMAILGGAVITPIQAIVSDSYGIYCSFVVPLLCFTIVLFFSFFALFGEKHVNEKFITCFSLFSMIIDNLIIDSLLEEADESSRFRANLDLRTSPNDSSQRMLNALLPGTVLPIHRHPRTTETLVLLRGKMEEIYYEVSYEGVVDGDSRCADVCRRRVTRETERIFLSANGPVQGLSIPVGQWHSINVLGPTVILECKDGAYEPLGPEDIIEQ